MTEISGAARAFLLPMMGKPKKPKPGRRTKSTGKRGVTSRKGARTRKKLLSLDEIDSHALLDDLQKKLCRSMRAKSRRSGESFTMLDFARIALRADGCQYADALSGGQDAEILFADASHRKSAILYVHELILDLSIPDDLFILVASSILKGLAVKEDEINYEASVHE